MSEIVNPQVCDSGRFASRQKRPPNKGQGLAGLLIRKQIGRPAIQGPHAFEFGQ
jgi:hypothetical protein